MKKYNKNELIDKVLEVAPLVNRLVNTTAFQKMIADKGLNAYEAYVLALGHMRNAMLEDIAQDVSQVKDLLTVAVLSPNDDQPNLPAFEAGYEWIDSIEKKLRDCMS